MKFTHKQRLRHNEEVPLFDGSQIKNMFLSEAINKSNFLTCLSRFYEECLYTCYFASSLSFSFFFFLLIHQYLSIPQTRSLRLTFHKVIKETSNCRLLQRSFQTNYDLISSSNIFVSSSTIFETTNCIFFYIQIRQHSFVITLYRSNA